LTPLFEGNVLTQRHQIWSQQSSDSALSYGKNPKSLSHVNLNLYRVLTDGRPRTYRRAELQ